jgi:outer membrane lipoprotein-sorting protein
MKKKAGLSAIIIISALYSCPYGGSAGEARAVPDVRPILQELQRKMSSVRSVYLEFTQERHLKLFEEPLKSEGVMLIERPDQIRWETTAPYQSMLIAKQKSVAQFEFEEGKWKKLNVGFPQLRRVMDQMVLMHQGKLEALESDFAISAATNSMTIITLTPKDENVRGILSSIEIYLLPDLSSTRQVIMHEPSGDMTKILFRKETRDVTFPPGTFDLKQPTDIPLIKKAINNGK